MRAINTITLEMCQFSDLPPGEYAVLSHCWGKNEVRYEAYCEGREDSESKLVKFLEVARKDGYEWAWCDTCCIDKRSSAELQEAILSMFRWYNKSGKCYIYIEDRKKGQDLKGCKWFTRGWTLQELIASESWSMFDKDWQEIGHKYELIDRVSELTGIEAKALRFWDRNEWDAYVVLHWAYKRQTERIEDRSYSLLGMLNISISIMYGEGERALMRLQEAVLNSSKDSSICWWNMSESENRTEGRCYMSPNMDGFSRQMPAVNDAKCFRTDHFLSSGGITLRAIWRPVTVVKMTTNYHDTSEVVHPVSSIDFELQEGVKGEIFATLTKAEEAVIEEAKGVTEEQIERIIKDVRAVEHLKVPGLLSFGERYSGLWIPVICWWGSNTSDGSMQFHRLNGDIVDMRCAPVETKGAGLRAKLG